MSIMQEQSFKDLFNFVVDFFKNPIEKIKSLPLHWTWPQMLILLAVISTVSGILSGFMPLNPYRILGGVFVSPFISFFLTSLMAVFIYYYFQIFERRTEDFKKIYLQILLSNLPFFLFQIASEILPPITLVGFAFTGLLMVVGLTDNFKLDRKKSIQLMGGIYFVVFLIWLWNRIDISRMT